MTQILDLRNQFLTFAQAVTGLNSAEIQLILLIILIYIVTLVFLTIFNKKIRKGMIELEKKIQSEYDNIRYLLSKFQYSNKQENKPNYGLRDLFNAGKMTYLPNHNEIKTGIKNFEWYVNQTVVGDDFWTKLEKIIKKFHFKRKFYKFVSLFLTIITLWIYKLVS